MKNTLIEEYNFERWTPYDLFYHLMDLGVLPYEEEFEEWRMLKVEMVRLCNETLNYDK